MHFPPIRSAPLRLSDHSSGWESCASHADVPILAMHQIASYCITFSIFLMHRARKSSLDEGRKNASPAADEPQAHRSHACPKRPSMHQNAPLFRFFRPPSDRLTDFRYSRAHRGRLAAEAATPAVAHPHFADHTDSYAGCWYILNFGRPAECRISFEPKTALTIAP